MRVALLNTKVTARGDYLMEAFAAGLKLHGDEPLWVRHRSDQKLLDRADVGMQICFPNRHHDGSDVHLFRLEAFERLTQSGRRVLVLDTGFVRNQPEAELYQTKPPFILVRPETYAAHDRRIYYAMGFDGIKRNADYGNAGDITNDRWRRLGAILKPWRPSGTHILLIGQPVHGQSTQHRDIRAWYAETADILRKVSRRSIIYRPHPRIYSLRTNAGRRKRDETMITEAAGGNKKFKYSKNRFLRDDLVGAWAAVCLTSNAAVECVLRGVPVIACDPACMTWDVSDRDLQNIEKPTLYDRLDWAHRLAYAQWNVAEIRNGECWKHLRPHATKGKA